MEVLGIDIGATNTRAGIVDITTGEITSDRCKELTPRPATLDKIRQSIKSVIDRYEWSGPVGVGFPGVVLENEVKTAPNLNNGLAGLNLEETLLELGAFEAKGINEADAAGTAEMQFGVGRNLRGKVLMINVGSGLGSALFQDGKLVPNLELGHTEFRGFEAESYISERARIEKNIPWKTWGNDFNGFLNYITELLSIDTIILGGGGVTQRDKFEDYLSLPCKYTFAKFEDDAGIIGAALAVNH